MKVDRAMREGPEDEDEEYDGEGENERRAERRGLLPKGVAGLLGATVAVLEKGEKVTLWGSGGASDPL